MEVSKIFLMIVMFGCVTYIYSDVKLTK